MQLNTLGRRLAVALSIALVATGCDSSSSPNGGATSRVSVQLTDAPGNIEAAVVTISEIYLQGGDADAHETLREEAFTTDLLGLANSVETLVSGHEVPNAAYSQLRFVITGAYIQVDNGDGTSSVYATSPDYEGLPAGLVVDGELQAPSFDTSGLKVLLTNEDLVLDGEAATYLVDFDVYQSFGREAGNGGQWVMHPVLKGQRLATAEVGTAQTTP